MKEDCQSFSKDESSQLDSLASANAQELVDGEEEKQKKIRRPGTYWKKPPIKIYADNFGFGVNGYQCMIDYLDTKDCSGRLKKGEIKLPLLEDRCLAQYSSRKPFKFYDNSEIDDFIDKGERICSRIRQNDIAAPGNVLRRSHSNYSMTKKHVQLVKKSNVVDYRKLREEADQAARGLIVPKVLKKVGLTFALNSMDPMNLTLMTAHNNLDHAIYMNSRRERLADLDDQYGNVIGTIKEGTEDLNRRATDELKARNRKNYLTAYDNAQSMSELADITENLAARNRLRRRLDIEALEEGVDEIIRADKSRNRAKNHMRELDDTIGKMESDITSLRRRHIIERADDVEIPLAVLNNMAKKKAHTMLNFDINDEDVNDPELARLRMRRAHRTNECLDDPSINIFHRNIACQPEVVSDVQSRVLQRAGEIAGQTSTHRHVNNRARYINIYVPRRRIADEDGIVLPSRTELNIDHMARSLASKGRIQRRFDVDEEGDLPVSGLNTWAYNQYNKMEALKPVDVVPSNSLRVRSAVCRARERNALAGQ